MLEFETRRRLRRLFGGPAPLRPEHADELGEELLARFDQLYPVKKETPMRRLWLKKVLLVAAAMCVVGVAACVAPADTDVMVGRSVTIRVPEGVAMPDPDAVAEVVRGTGDEQGVLVRVRGENGVKTVEIDVWNDTPLEGHAADRIRAKFPELAAAQIHEEALEAPVRGTLGAKLGHEFLNLDLVDAKDKDKAKQELMAQLAAQGVNGTVDVQVDGEGKDRRVKVRVQRVEEAPAGEEGTSGK